jgi:hypothetical protein
MTMKKTRRLRRGSTLVMVGILLVAFVGVGAIGADIGRFYVVNGELQTAADAAALVGAMRLQGSSCTNCEVTVENEVMPFVASTNRSNASALTVNTEMVRTAFYTPEDVSTNPDTPSDIDYVLNGRRPNAVSVTTAMSPKGVFSQLIGRVTGLDLRKTATAWIANLGSNCVRPWSFPYEPLYAAVNGTPATVFPAPDLDPAKFVAYEQLPVTDTRKRFIMLGDDVTYTGQPTSGSWNGFNFGGNAGIADFQDGIDGCEYAANTSADNGVTLPGNGGQYVGFASARMAGVNGQASPLGNKTGPICRFLAGEATCYPLPPAALASGQVQINVVWADLVGVGSHALNFRFVGEFTLWCYFRDSAESCPDPSNPTGPVLTGYPEGTLVGVMGGLKSRIITPNDVFTNTPSNVQRIILVR